MSKFTSATPCFSGECGLCMNCCGGTDHYLTSHNDRRAKELYLMLGKDSTEEYRKYYNTKLNTWCKNRGYRDPYDRGWAHNTIKVNYSGTIYNFSLSEDKHNRVCGNHYCKMLYHSANEWDQKKKFPNYPIYRNDDKNLSLCSICIDKE